MRSRVMRTVTNRISQIIVILFLSIYGLWLYRCNGNEEKIRARAVDSIITINSIKRNFNQRQYLTIIKQLEKGRDLLESSEYWWYVADIYWELARMYELGYYAGVQLQIEVYQSHLETWDDDLSPTALTFLSYDYYLQEQRDKGAEIAKLAKPKVKKDEWLRNRLDVLASKPANCSQNSPNYLFALRVHDDRPSAKYLEDRLGKFNKINVKENIANQVDLLFWAGKTNHQDVIKRVLSSNFRSFDVFQQEILLQGDKGTSPYTLGYKDMIMLKIRSDLYYQLYSEAIDSLLNIESQTSPDPFLYERKAWSDFHQSKYQSAAEYFHGFIGILPDYYQGDELQYYWAKYSALENLCQDLAQNSWKHNPLDDADVFSNPITINAALQYYCYSRAIGRTEKSQEFLTLFQNNSKLLECDLSLAQPVQAAINLENIMLYMKLCLYNNQAPIAKAQARWVNNYVKNYTIEEMQGLYGNCINAPEYFSLFPAVLSHDIEHLYLVSQAYMRSINENPLATELSEIIQKRDHFNHNKSVISIITNEG